MGTAARFLELLYGDLEDGAVALWRSDTKKSQFIRPGHWEEADSFASQKCDAYFGVGVQARALGPSNRGKASSVIAIPGLWADFDLSGKPHEGKTDGKKYPPRATVEHALKQLPVPPSVVVSTGYGLHPYWLFQEPWSLDDPERAEAHSIERGWLHLIKRKLGEYELDMVHDLARVMRLPGSIHQKTGRTVEVDRWDCPRYSIDDFRPFALEIVTAAPRDMDSPMPVEMPFLRWVALLDNSPEFKKTWDRKRTEFSSQSEYDLSLASQLASAGWSDSEIVSALRNHRIRYGENVEKLDRHDYVASTLQKARSGHHMAVADLHKALSEPASDKPDNDRQRLLDAISRAIGVEVDGWLQSGRERALGTLRLRDGREIVIGPIEKVRESPKLMADRLCVEIQHEMDVPLKKWPAVRQALTKIVEVVETKGEERTRTAVMAMIRDYVFNGLDTMGAGADQRQVAVSEGRPFVDGDTVHLSLPELMRHMAIKSTEKLDRSTVINVLRQEGFQTEDVCYRRGEKVSRKTYWHGTLDE